MLRKPGDAMTTSGERVARDGSRGKGCVQLDLEAALAAIDTTAELALIGISSTAAWHRPGAALSGLPSGLVAPDDQ